MPPVRALGPLNASPVASECGTGSLVGGGQELAPENDETTRLASCAARARKAIVTIGVTS